MPRATLLEQVWGYGDAITTHTLETHLYRLRGKLRDAFGGQELVVWAISDGREAARAIDIYLMGASDLPSKELSKLVLGS